MSRRYIPMVLLDGIFTLAEMQAITSNAKRERLPVSAIIGIGFEVKANLETGESFIEKLRSAVRHDVCQPIKTERLTEIAKFHRQSDANESVCGSAQLEAIEMAAAITDDEWEWACKDADLEVFYFDTKEAAKQLGISRRAVQKRKKRWEAERGRA